MSAIDAIVLFGATGDLAKKMLLPALYRLEATGRLPGRIVGVALEDWDTARFREHVKAALDAAVPEVDRSVLARLSERIGYVAGDYTEDDTFDRLASALGDGARPLHYLAIPPAMFETVTGGLRRTGLLDGARLMVEKPFGRDLDSARHLNRVLHEAVPEESIYRIDHFLGKEAVENLLVFRHANPIVDAFWSGAQIDHVQLTMAESFGVDGRGSLYESLGVVRDVVQNHLLQVICLLTMDPPAAPDAGAFAAARRGILASTRTIDPSETVFGQYEGYRDVDHVAPDSSVPTFVAFRLWIDTPRWDGVPFLVRTGKGMATTATTATVVFRDASPLPFAEEGPAPGADRLTFRIGPDHGVDLALQTKVPGDGMRVRPTTLSVDYDAVFGRIPRAYERIFEEALSGDRTQFSDEGGVEEAWRIVGDIADPVGDPRTYARGTWGPVSAASIPADGRAWVQPA